MLYYKYFYDGTEYVKSNIDGNSYRVRNEVNNQHKADLLAIMYTKLNVIVNSLNESKYKNNIPVKRLKFK